MLNKKSIVFNLYFIIIVMSSFAIGKNHSGKELYRKYCFSCHGLEGKGDGELSYLLYPKPRDFTSNLFKIKSTQAGNPPTDNDLITTIKKGMPGTSMPSFNFLDSNELKDIVSYIKDLGNIDNTNSVLVQIPSEISKTDELLKLGKSIYTEIGCNKCHGETGKGDGLSSNSLIDSWGYSIIPRDFTSGVYLGGGQIQDLYLRFASGMDGTPMPSYGNLSELLGKPKEDENELAWSLVHYVKSLETGISIEAINIPEDGKITAFAVNNNSTIDQLLDVSSSLWGKINSYSIPISRLWQSENINYQTVEVQAVYSSKYIAFKLEWEDLTMEESLYRVQDFQDAAAIQFSVDGSMDFHGMGSKKHPTDIWFWKAEWQILKSAGVDSDIEHVYLNRVSDSDVESYPDVFNDTAFLSGRDAGNINSKKKRTTSVENVMATGPETVTSLEENLQKVVGEGSWDGDKWRIVLVRELRSKSKQQVKFKKGDIVPIGFAVWNGSENDRNGQKMVSTWYKLELKD